MPIDFDGSDDAITLALGALGFALGTGSIAAVARPDTTPTQYFLHLGTSSGTTRWNLNGSGTAVLRVQCGGTSFTAPTITLTTGEWGLYGANKAAGTNPIRFHKYLYSSNAWTHENDNVSAADSTAPTGNAFIGNQLGSGGTEAFDGQIQMVAVWDVALTDDQWESLPHSFAAWFAPAQPKLLAFLDQSETSILVMDLSGNGSNETSRTGTAVGTASPPPLASGAEPLFIFAADAGSTLKSASDSGSGSETPTLNAAYSNTDAIASAEAAALSGALPGTDAGAGADTSTPLASLPTTEDGSGADSPTLLASLPTTESGSDTENTALTAVLSASDLIAGGDVPALTGQLPTTDAGTGADVGSSSIAQNVSDTGSAVDAVESLNALILSSDSGALASEVVTLVAALVASDSGGSNDLIEALTAALGVTDTGSGADVGSQAQTVQVIEAAVGAEAAVQVAAYVLPEGGGAEESVVIAAAYLLVDAATGVDLASVIIAGAVYEGASAVIVSTRPDAEVVSGRSSAGFSNSRPTAIIRRIP